MIFCLWGEVKNPDTRSLKYSRLVYIGKDTKLLKKKKTLDLERMRKEAEGEQKPYWDGFQGRVLEV